MASRLRVARVFGASCVIGANYAGKRDADCNMGWFGSSSPKQAPNSIYVWGSTRPESKNGNQQTLLTPTRLRTVGDSLTFTSVALGPSCIVAATSAGELLLWSDTQSDPIVLYQKSGNGAPRQVAATQNQIVCVTQSGELLRWEMPNQASSAKLAMQTYSELRGQKILSVGAGLEHLIIVTTKGKVFAVGNNQYGQLGLGTKAKFVDVPTLVEPFEGIKVTQASCGERHSIFIDSKGGCWTCGSDQWLQLGRGASWNDVASRRRAISRVPVAVEPFKDQAVVHTAAAADTSLFVVRNSSGPGATSGALHTCGFGQFGQLANGKYTHYSNEILPAKGLGEITFDREQLFLACGTSHCAMVEAEANRIFTWGKNNLGQCGNGKRMNLNSPTLIPSFGQQKVLSVSCNFDQSAVICEEVKAKC